MSKLDPVTIDSDSEVEEVVVVGGKGKVRSSPKANKYLFSLANQRRPLLPPLPSSKRLPKSLNSAKPATSTKSTPKPKSPLTQPQSPAKKRRTSVPGKKVQEEGKEGKAGKAGKAEEEEEWCHKYAPKDTSELCVHKGTVRKVATWLASAGPGAVLVLHGVCGAGKTAMVEVLAREHHLPLQHWITGRAPALPALLAWLKSAARTPDLVTRAPRLLLLEDLPTLDDSTAPLFRDALRQFLGGAARLIWIYSDPFYNQSDLTRLLADLTDPRLTLIGVRPVTELRLLAILKRIAAAEGLKPVFDPPRAGDLRHAINMLQFGSRTGGPTTPSMRDVNAHLFSALGRILNNKRAPGVGDERGLPQDDPEELRSRLHLSQAYFNQFLHDNYLEFVGDIDDVVQIAEHHSLANILEARDSFRGQLEPYYSSIPTRATYLFNNSPTPPGFRPFYKPKALEATKTREERLREIPPLFFLQNKFPLSAVSDFSITTLPLARKFMNFWKTQGPLAPGTRTFLDSLTVFGRGRDRAMIAKGEAAPELPAEQAVVDELGLGIFQSGASAMLSEPPDDPIQD